MDWLTVCFVLILLRQLWALFFPSRQFKGDKKHVLILGGGFAGHKVAHLLAKHDHFSVTVLDRKKYFENNMSISHFLFQPNKLKRYFKPWSRCFPYSILTIPGDVLRVLEGRVLFRPHDDEKPENVYAITYDYLVIASGSRYHSPFKSNCIEIEERLDELRKFSAEISTAKSILVVGGGPVGVETATHLAADLPRTTTLTVVHPHHKLLHTLPSGCGESAERFLKRRKVNLIHGCRWVKTTTDGMHHLSDGSVIAADKLIKCFGNSPNTEYLQIGWLSHALNKSGEVQVLQSLQVHARPNVFCVGDAAATPYPKLAANALLQAETAAANITQLETDTGAPAPAPSSPSTSPKPEAEPADAASAPPPAEGGTAGGGGGGKGKKKRGKAAAAAAAKNDGASAGDSASPSKAPASPPSPTAGDSASPSRASASPRPAGGPGILPTKFDWGQEVLTDIERGSYHDQPSIITYSPWSALSTNAWSPANLVVRLWRRWWGASMPSKFGPLKYYV